MRFPLLNAYRLLLMAGAFVVFGVGCFGIVFAVEKQARFGSAFAPAILVLIGAVALLGLGLLVIAEVIRLLISIEDHLFHLRGRQFQSGLEDEIQLPAPIISTTTITPNPAPDYLERFKP